MTSTPNSTIQSASGSTHLLRESVVIAGRTALHWRARPGMFAVQLLFPVMILLMMGGLFGGAIAGDAGDYFVYVLPGVLALNMMFGIEATMTALASDATKTVTDRFRSLPIAGGSVLLGRVLADLMTSVVELAALSAAGFALGWLAEFNPLSAVATTARELFTGADVDGVGWAATHAAPYAIISQALLFAAFATLGIRAYRNLGQ